MLNGLELLPAEQIARNDTSAIILLTELYPPAVGGSAVLFHEIYRRVSGAPVLIVTEPRQGTRPPGFSNERFEMLRVGSDYWGVARPAALVHHLRNARVLKRLATEHNGLVHCGRALPEGVAAWLARRCFGVRYGCWAHGEDLVTGESSRELALLTRRVYRGAEFALANSHNTAQMLEQIGVTRDRITVVHPGVDAVRFSPAVDGRTVRKRFADENDLVLLSVGRLQRRKGQDTAIRAVAALRRDGLTLRYVIVGDGEDRLYLQGLAAECGVADVVYLPGEVSAAELPEFYAASDIFLLPNRIEHGDIEGFGIVFLEAASAGKPVVGGNSGGVPEAVDDGRTGLLVSGTDVGELANAIRRLADDPGFRQRLGLAGRERVLRSFTWQRAADAVAEVHRRARRARG